MVAGEPARHPPGHVVVHHRSRSPRHTPSSLGRHSSLRSHTHALLDRMVEFLKARSLATLPHGPSGEIRRKIPSRRRSPALGRETHRARAHARKRSTQFKSPPSLHPRSHGRMERSSLASTRRSAAIHPARAPTLIHPSRARPNAARRYHSVHSSGLEDIGEKELFQTGGHCERL